MELKHVFTKALRKFVIGQNGLSLVEEDDIFNQIIPKITAVHKLFRHASQKAYLMVFQSLFFAMTFN